VSTSTLDPALAEAVAKAGRSLPVVHADKLAGHLAATAAPSRLSLHQAKLLVAAPAFTDACTAVWKAWEATPAIPGIALAMGVSAAARAAQAERTDHSDELVVTGPTSWQVPTRETSTVVKQVIDGATSSLLLISYASYRVPWLITALDAAHTRGVHVRMLLESAPGIHAADAFTDLGGKVSLLTWPIELRPVVGAKPAAMHAKAVIADRSVAFLTSANLTGSAMDHNLEVGVLIRGGPLPDKLHRHFDQLEADGTLKPV
jgi:phosphatidylserine/phosphatidylglycerophosphate/cardiolipin synthase-like enzyme